MRPATADKFPFLLYVNDSLFFTKTKTYLFYSLTLFILSSVAIGYMCIFLGLVCLCDEALHGIMD